MPRVFMNPDLENAGLAAHGQDFMYHAGKLWHRNARKRPEGGGFLPVNYKLLASDEADDFRAVEAYIQGRLTEVPAPHAMVGVERLIQQRGEEFGQGVLHGLAYALAAVNNARAEHVLDPMDSMEPANRVQLQAADQILELAQRLDPDADLTLLWGGNKRRG